MLNNAQVIANIYQLILFVAIIISLDFESVNFLHFLLYWVYRGLAGVSLVFSSIQKVGNFRLLYRMEKESNCRAFFYLLIRSILLFVIGGLSTIAINIMQMEYKTALFPNNFLLFFKTYGWAVLICGFSSGKFCQNKNRLEKYFLILLCILRCVLCH
jgi:hypothetical protein